MYGPADKVTQRTRRRSSSAAGYTEREMALTVAGDPRPRTRLGASAKLEPNCGGQAAGGADNLWRNRMMHNRWRQSADAVAGAADEVIAQAVVEVVHGALTETEESGPAEEDGLTDQFGQRHRT